MAYLLANWYDFVELIPHSQYIGFVNDTRNLVNKLVMQGFELAALRNKFLKFYKYYLDLWGKYGVDIYSKDIIDIFKQL